MTTKDELVEATIKAADDNPESWWITRHGTVLINNPDVALYIGGGLPMFRFGVAMPPVYGREDIAPIPISVADRLRLWATLGRVKIAQLENRRAKALASIKLTEPTT